jgi:hypothetical protein
MSTPFFFHWYLTGASLLVLTEKDAGWPATTVTSSGCALMFGPAGAAQTVSFASGLTADPASLLATARNVAPSSDNSVAGNVYQLFVAPGMSTPFLCH